VFCGIVSGAFYDVLYIARCAVCGVNKSVYTIKDKIFIFFCDLFYFVIFALGFIFMSNVFDFFEFRLFMLLACGVGAILYLKSLHILVAFFVNKVYNDITKRNKSKVKPSKETK
jgi:hypothetical protein